jgi:hypothetical protein
MKEFVGVKFIRFSVESLKREAIVFDRIGVDDLIGAIDSFRKSNTSEDLIIASELEWLQDQNVLLDIKPLFMNTRPLSMNINLLGNKRVIKEWKSFRKLMLFSAEGIRDSTDGVRGSISKRDLSSIEGYHRVMSYSMCRFASFVLREYHGMDAFPIIDPIDFMKLPSNTFVRPRKAEVIKIILNLLPIPDDSVPWEQILDYRNDPDSKERAFSLRRWISRVSGEKLSVSEIQDEAEWLIHEYQKHMNLHKMKTNLMTLEALVKTPLEVLENLVKIKWSKLPDPLFAIKKRTVSILEAELNAPGRELSYIIKTNETFAKPKNKLIMKSLTFRSC